MMYSLKFSLITLFCALSFYSFGQSESNPGVKIYVSPDQQMKKFEKIEFKGERRSLYNWAQLKEEEFLSLDEWKKNLKIKESTPQWRRNLMERRLREKMGHVLECVGTCKSFRGMGRASIDFMSTIREGDEITTDSNSYLWVFLLDGTMVRMSPKSSVTFKEFNIGVKENFLYSRVNYGNVLWWSRTQDTFKIKDFKETDTLFLPLSFYDAKEKDLKKEIDEDNLYNFLKVQTNYSKKYNRLNWLITQSLKTYRKNTKSFITFPNGSIYGESVIAEMIVLNGNKTYLKQRTRKQAEYTGEGTNPDLHFYFRGFNKSEDFLMTPDRWYEVNREGRNITETLDTRIFAMGEFLTRNIPSIMIARELLFQKHSKYVHMDVSPKQLAVYFGHRLWGSSENENSDFSKRLRFLKEYTRRVETTNLIAYERFKQKLEKRGEQLKAMTYGSDFYEKAIGDFYNYQEGVSILTDRTEPLNSELKPFWKRIHGIKE